MINLESKIDCCGCSACSSICGHGCITMKSDAEGFLYPEIDFAKCVDCGLCEQVCPIANVLHVNKVAHVVASKNLDDKTRFKSSSGGVFQLLAEKILEEGGVVVGCRFDENMKAVHSIAVNMKELDGLMSSKYVQSDTRGIYERVRTMLKNGTQVLFSGVPCQVAALKNYLRISYENLITIDILCHGVPSPKFFKEYITSLMCRYGGKMTSLSFRWKEKSWKRLYINAIFNNNKRHFLYAGYDSYMQLFLSDRLQRPSCFHCPYNTLHRPGDITLGDFWGIGKKFYDFDDNKGVSMVLINNAIGSTLWEKVADKTIYFETDIDTAVAGNRVLISHLPDQSKRDEFYKEYVAHGFKKAILKYAPETSRMTQLYQNFMRCGLDCVRKIMRKSY